MNRKTLASKRAAASRNATYGQKKKKIRINSLEGYVRQVIGWREFMRGIYQSYSNEMETGNFFKQNRKMKKSWYDGTTGLPPLDYAIKNALNHCEIKI